MLETGARRLGTFNGDCADSESALTPGCLEELVAEDFVEAAVFY